MGMETRQIARILKDLAKVAKVSKGRPHLECMVATITGSSLVMHGTDGHRVHMFSVPLYYSDAEGEKPAGRLAIPLAALTRLTLLVEAAGPQILAEQLLALLHANHDESIQPPPIGPVVPEWSDEAEGTGNLQVDPKYLGAACASAQIVGGNIRIQVGASPQEPMRIDVERGGASFLGVIMPTRG